MRTGFGVKTARTSASSSFLEEAACDVWVLAARVHQPSIRAQTAAHETRPSVYEFEADMERMTVPTLIVTGDEDEPCLEPALFMKRKIRSSGLVVIPKAGHTINLEDPDAFNRAVLDFLTAVDAGRWPMRNPASVSASAILPPEPARQGAPSR